MTLKLIALSLMSLTIFTRSGLCAGSDGGASRSSSVLSTTFASDYFTKPDVPGRGPVNQTLLYSQYAVDPHRDVSGLFWTDYDFSDKVFHEIDLGVYFKARTSSKRGLLDGQLEARFGYEIFIYPSKLLGESPDHIIRTGLHYSGPIEVDAEFTQLLTSGGGQMVALTLSKAVIAFRNDRFALVISPALKATVLNNFFGVDGLSKVSPGAGVALSFAKLSYFFGVEIQNGRHGMQDHQYSGGISLRF